MYDFKTVKNQRSKGFGGKMLQSLLNVDINILFDDNDLTMGAYWTGLLFKNSNYDSLMKFYIDKGFLPVDAIGYLTPTNKLIIKDKIESLTWNDPLDGKTKMNTNLKGHCMGGSIITPFLSLYHMYDKKRDLPSIEKSLDTGLFLKNVYDKLMKNGNLCVCVTPQTLQI
jgi:hypothetical protein